MKRQYSALILQKSKTSLRKVPINKQCVEALQKQIKQKEELMVNKHVLKEFKDLLFTTRNGNPIAIPTIQASINMIINKADSTRHSMGKIEYFSLHCLHHTFATRCFEAGINPKTVQEYLGHSSLKMTWIYNSCNGRTAAYRDEKIRRYIRRDNAGC